MDNEDSAGFKDVGSGTFGSKILWYSAMDCEDHRDKVYGLLGMVDPHFSVPEIDYNRPVERVYIDALHVILRGGHTDSAPRRLYIAQFLMRNMCLSERYEDALERLFKIFENFDTSYSGPLPVDVYHGDLECS